jgi:ATP-dependent Zn protease
MSAHNAGSRTPRRLDERGWREVRCLIEAVHSDVGDLLARHRDRLDSLTAALLKTETHAL